MSRRQVNITIDSGLADVLDVLMVRDRTSLPAILRPVIEEFLREALSTREVAAAVEAVRAAREQAEHRRSGSASP